MRLDGPTFARAWLAVAQASATKDDVAALSKTVAIEEHVRGLRLVATDRFMLLTAWVPSLDASSIAEPGLDEAPDRTVIAHDGDGRGKSLLGYVLTLARRMKLEDLPVGSLEVRLDFDVKVPAGDDVPETFEGMEPIFVMLDVPDTEKVYLPVVQAEYPSWRAVTHGFVAQPTSALALGPDLVGRVANVARWSLPPLVLTFGGHDRVVAVDYPESDPHVTGLLMPRRWVLPGEPAPEAETDTDDDGEEEAPAPKTPPVTTSFLDALHRAAAEALPEGVTIETADGRTTAGTADPADADDYDDDDGDRLHCPVCPRFADVSPEDPDTSLADLVAHVETHGYDHDDALAAIHADDRNAVATDV